MNPPDPVRVFGEAHGSPAAQALKNALPIAGELGISEVLLTCNEDSAGSRATIEANGGVLEDIRHGKLRYWIAGAQQLLTPRPSSPAPSGALSSRAAAAAAASR